jgi:hypothetical protein
VTHHPFLALPHTEELGAGHEEDSPALDPLLHRRFAVHRGEHRPGLVPPRIEQLEPRVGGFFVVATVPGPLLVHVQVALETQGQVCAGHDSAGEEVTAHPVAGAVVDEGVGRGTVAEDVHEELPAGTQPAVDPTE